MARGGPTCPRLSLQCRTGWLLSRFLGSLGTTYYLCVEGVFEYLCRYLQTPNLYIQYFFSVQCDGLNGLGEFGASLQSPLHVEAAWRGRHLRRKIIRAGHLPSTSICQRHLLEQPTATLGHLRTQPKATIGHLGPPLASWVSASTHLRAINSTNHQIFQTRYKPWTSKCFSWRCR